MKLKIKLLNEKAKMPLRATEGSAGYDLFAAIDEPVTILPQQTVKIGTGVCLELPDAGMAAFVFARSGLGIKHNIVPANCVGVIDSDYRGEVIVGLINLSSKPYEILPGDRIAQLVLLPVLHPETELCTELDETERGAGGFGSTNR